MAIVPLDRCIFTTTAGGTADFVVSAAVLGYMTPAQAGAVNATQYRYAAQSADLTQWEIGTGIYSTTGPTLARTTVIFSSNANAKVNFTVPPQVIITILAEDIVLWGTGSMPPGSNGQVLVGVTSAQPAFTSTPTLGAAGTTLGTITFAGNTGGTVTIQPSASAGNWNITLPTGPGIKGQAWLTDGIGVGSWGFPTNPFGSI